MSERWFGQGRTRALLSVCALLGAGAVVTSASWRDQGTVGGTSFSTGALHIDLASNVRVKPESIAWPGPSLLNLGSSVSKSVVVAVTNNSQGNSDLSYRIQGAATNTGGGNLVAALQITVRRGGTSDGSTCSGGTLVGSANSALSGFDQPAGANLTPTQSHSVCLQITRAASPAVTTGSQASVTLTFPATQVP